MAYTYINNNDIQSHHSQSELSTMVRIIAYTYINNNDIQAHQSRKFWMRNFQLWCDYLPSELSTNGAWRNPPSFWNHFSHTMVESSESKLLTEVRLFAVGSQNSQPEVRMGD